MSGIFKLEARQFVGGVKMCYWEDGEDFMEDREFWAVLLGLILFFGGSFLLFKIS